MNQDMKNNFFEEINEKITCNTISPDKKISIVGLNNGNIVVLDDKHQIMLKLNRHSSAVKSIEFTPDRRYCKTISEDSIITWDIGISMITSKENLE